MYTHRKMLLLLLSLPYFTTYTVNTVTPDDYYYPNTTCHHCHNLQHYLLNVTKYFTSNTQLLFLPGLHHLHTDLIIQNVHNISLIGSTANGTTLDTVIQCNSSVGIVMTNITNLTVKNFIIQACQQFYLTTKNGSLLSHLVTVTHYFSSVIIIKDCTSVLVHHLQIYSENPYIFYHIVYNSLIGINILGNSHFSHISCLKMLFRYNRSDMKMKKKHQKLFIDNYETKQYPYHDPKYAISFSMLQNSYNIAVYLFNTTFQNRNTTFISVEHISEGSVIHIMGCKFQFNSDKILTACNNAYCNGSVYFTTCKFLHNTSPLLMSIKSVRTKIEHCIFHNNSHILNMNGRLKCDTEIIINNTSFVNVNFNYICINFLELRNVSAFLSGSVTFSNIICNASVMFLMEYSTITINGIMNMSCNRVNSLISFSDSNYQYMIVKENSYVIISQNQVCTLFTLRQFHAYENKPFPYPHCFFQYSMINNVSMNKIVQQGNFSITFHFNYHHKNTELK